MIKKGFTILELAIVLTISGVLIAGSVKLITGAITSNRFTASKDTIQTVMKDVAEFSAKAQRIPVNANTANYTITSAAGEIFDVATVHNDAFQRPLVYIPAPELTTDNVSGDTTGLCGLNTASLTVQAGGQTFSNVAFVVISGGEDGTVQSTVSGNTVTIDTANDIAGWMTFDTLRKFAGCDGYALGIKQNKLPAAEYKNSYDFNLTPKGGKKPYKWCIETDQSTLLGSQMYYNASGTTDSTHGLKAAGTCQPADYVTGDTIHLHSNTQPLSFTNSDPSNARITVKLLDTNNISISKDFDLRIIRPQELSLLAPGKSKSYSGFNDFVSSNSFDNTSYSKPNTHAYYFSPDGSSLSVVMNTDVQNDMESAFIGCDPDPEGINPCPAFGNHGLFQAYFTLERYDQNTWSHQLGFTFALVKSYEPGTHYQTTVGLTGVTDVGAARNDDAGDDSGLGYGGSGGNKIGLRYGNSFAVEFDTYQDDNKDDPYVIDINNTNHIGIVTYTAYNLYNGYFESYGNNIHSSQNDDLAEIISNDSCTENFGSGCYYSPDNLVIPNTYTGGDKIGIRVEAISGCNSTGTICNRQTGANNYICVKMWRAPLATMTTSPALAEAMKDTTTNYIYNFLQKNTNYPVGNPILQKCYPDNTNTPDTLDYVRFGFTASTMYAQYCVKTTGQIDNCNPHKTYDYDNILRYFKMTEFSARVKQY